MRLRAFRLKPDKLSRAGILVRIALGVILIGILAAAGFLLFNKTDGVVMRIGNYPITQEHLTLYENDLRAEVASYFYQEYQSDPNEKEFWTTSIHGEVPGEVLREKATEELLLDTVERIEAAKIGISTDITLDDMKKSLEAENRQRKEGGQVSYGPQEYGLMEYISKTQMETRDALKEKLLESKLKPTEEQLRELYEEADAAYFDKGSKAKAGIYMYYGMKVGEYPQELGEVWELVKAELDKGTAPDTIVTAVNSRFSTVIEYEEAEYDTNSLPRDNQEIAWLVEQVGDMEAGQCSDVLDYGASQAVIKVLDKTDYGKAGFEESMALLTNMWINEKYPEYLRTCMDSYR